MKDKTLKPCPFCGAEPEYGSLGGDKQNWAIWCPDCGIPCSETGLQGATLTEIKKMWNSREKQGPDNPAPSADSD